MNSGEYQGRRILQAATVQTMRTPQYPTLDPDIGILWFHARLGLYDLWGHEGGDPGVSTLMYYRVKDNVGVIALTNGDPQSAATHDVATKLCEEAASL
jgi:hypothetical protein